jgi:hypothetical protein
LLAVGLMAFSATAVLAGPESGVDVVVHDADTEVVAPGDPPAACTFHLHFTAAAGIAGAFEIREGDPDGPAAASGVFDTSSGDSRAPASGTFQLAEGSYYVIWDDEAEMDRSFDEQTVEVVCEDAPVPTPSGSDGGVSPSPTGSELPVESESPGGSELPVEGPTGSVAGVTVTPPATDTGVAQSSTGSTFGLALAVLLGLSGLLAAWSLRLREVTDARRTDRR